MNLPDKYSASLYNLKKDIAEEKETNLAVTNPEKLQALSDLLDQWEGGMSKIAVPFEPSDPAKRNKK